MEINKIAQKSLILMALNCFMKDDGRKEKNNKKQNKKHNNRKGTVWFLFLTGLGGRWG